MSDQQISMTNTFLCVANIFQINIFQINIFLVFQHVFFETNVDLSNYYIELVLLVFCIFFLLYS